MASFQPDLDFTGWRLSLASSLHGAMVGTWGIKEGAGSTMWSGSAAWGP